MLGHSSCLIKLSRLNEFTDVSTQEILVLLLEVGTGMSGVGERWLHKAALGQGQPLVLGYQDQQGIQSPF